MTATDAAADQTICCPFEDNTEISDQTVLYRRLPGYHLVPVGDQPRPRRITSNAFCDPDPMGVSFYAAHLLAAEDHNWQEIIPASQPDWGVASFTAGAARKQGFGVRMRPDPDDAGNPLNYAHGELTGLRKGKPGHKQAKPLAASPTELLELPEQQT